jgi:hypothetical protein
MSAGPLTLRESRVNAAERKWRSDLKAIRILTSLFVVLVAGSAAFGGIRPSFMPETCSWRATDIVVVTEGERIDGVFKVLETLKGDLKSGETIEIPEMSEFKPKEARLVSEPWYQNSKNLAPVYVTGNRMILFLIDAKRAGKADDDDKEDGEQGELASKPNTSRWRSANPMGDEVKYSTVWIEGSEVYCFIQMINPGPSLLSQHGGKESDLTNEITEVSSVQASLNNAIANSDPAKRAESLRPFVRSSIYLAKETSLKQLAGCGKAALPVLRDLLNDESTVKERADIIDTLEAAGGNAIGPDLTAIVEKETVFWKATGSSLKSGWWNGQGFESLEQVEPLRTRWLVVDQALLSLEDTRYDGCEKAVTEFRDVLRSMPQLYMEHTSRICDQILRNLNQKKGQRPKAAIPPYKVNFSGNTVFSSEALESKFEEFVAKYQELEESYDGDMFQYAIAKMGDFFSTQGYQNWQVDSSIGSNEHGVAISVDVNEGSRCRLGAVTVAGAKAFSPEEIRSKLMLHSGDVADGVMIQEWLVEIERSYKNLGYLEISANEDRDLKSGPRGSDADIVNLKIAIDEGARFKIGSIVFAGKSDVSEDDLRRLLGIREGDFYSLEKVEASIDAINKLGLNVDKRDDVRERFDRTRNQVSLTIVLDKRTSRHWRSN